MAIIINHYCFDIDRNVVVSKCCVKHKLLRISPKAAKNRVSHRNKFKCYDNNDNKNNNSINKNNNNNDSK